MARNDRKSGWQRAKDVGKGALDTVGTVGGAVAGVSDVYNKLPKGAKDTLEETLRGVKNPQSVLRVLSSREMEAVPHVQARIFYILFKKQIKKGDSTGKTFKTEHPIFFERLQHQRGNKVHKEYGSDIKYESVPNEENIAMRLIGRQYEEFVKEHKKELDDIQHLFEGEEQKQKLENLKTPEKRFADWLTFATADGKCSIEAFNDHLELLKEDGIRQNARWVSIWSKQAREYVEKEEKEQKRQEQREEFKQNFNNARKDELEKLSERAEEKEPKPLRKTKAFKGLRKHTKRNRKRADTRKRGRK